MTRTTITTTAYDELTRHWTRLHRFGHLQSIAGWDQSAMMPPGGSEARAEFTLDSAVELARGVEIVQRVHGDGEMLDLAVEGGIEHALAAPGRATVDRQALGLIVAGGREPTQHGTGRKVRQKLRRPGRDR